MMYPDTQMMQRLDRGRPLSGRSLLTLFVIAVGSLVVALRIVDATEYLLPVLALVPLLVFALHNETERVRLGEPPRWVPLLVIVLPYAWIVGARWALLLQVAVCMLVVLYLALLTAEQRGAAVRRVLPVLIPSGLLLVVVSISYLVSSDLSTEDVLKLISLVSSLGVSLLAGIYALSPRRFETLIELIVLVVVLQLPVVIAQALGLTNGLPSALSSLNATAFGGTLADPTISVAGGGSSALGFVFRFPGTFGDYELLAECAGLALVLCVGMIIFGLGERPRWQLIVAAGCALAVGWFTGTRSFVVATAGAIVVLAALAIVMSGNRMKRVRRFAAGLALLAVALIWLIPRQITTGLLSRFVLSDVSITGPNAFNRGSLFRIWWDLAGEMPAFGYGTRMLDVINASHPSFVLESPHSLYFSVLLTAGWLGLFALAVLIVATIVTAARTVFSGPTPLARYWGAVLLAAVLYLFVNEIKIEFLRIPFYMDLVFLLLGLVAVARSLPELEKDESGSRGAPPAHASTSPAAVRGRTDGSRVDPRSARS